MPRLEPRDSLTAMLQFLWGLLDTRRRWQAVGLQLLSLAMGVATLGGIAAVVPFFAVLGDPSLITSNVALSRLHDLLAFESDTAFLTFLGVCFVAMVLVANAVNFVGLL